MKRFFKNKRQIIVYSVSTLAVIIIIAVFCFMKANSPMEEGKDSTIKTELQGDDIEGNDVKDSTKNEDEESSKEETLNSSKEETESQKDTFDNIFDEKSETTNDSTEDKSEVTDDNSEDSVEGDSGTGDDDVTQDDETKENLEESEDTSTGYGPIS